MTCSAELDPDTSVDLDRDARRRGESPRVLVVHGGSDRYGSDKQLLQSVEALRAAGCPVTVCVPTGGPLLAALTGVATEIVPFRVLRKALLGPLGALQFAARLPGEVIRLARAIRRLNPDVVYVNTITIPAWVFAARLARVPVVVHVHEAEADVARVVRIALAAPLALASYVIANSASSRRVLTDAVPRLADRVRVVLNGVPDPAAAADVVPIPGRVALVGRLSPRKGIDVALDAVALLRRRGQDVTLDVCGSAFAGYEWYEQQLRERASAPDLAGAVVFHGYVENPHEVLARSGAVLVPSRVEPFGNASVEAMLARRPVIVSDVQGLAEIVIDMHTGLLVPPGDPAALASALARVLGDPALAAALAERGRAEALARFSPQRYGAQVLTLVRSAAVDAGRWHDR